MIKGMTTGEQLVITTGKRYKAMPVAGDIW
jgi:hypothetical protein